MLFRSQSNFKVGILYLTNRRKKSGARRKGSTRVRTNTCLGRYDRNTCLGRYESNRIRIKLGFKRPTRSRAGCVKVKRSDRPTRLICPNSSQGKPLPLLSLLIRFARKQIHPPENIQLSATRRRHAAPPPPPLALPHPLHRQRGFSGPALALRRLRQHPTLLARIDLLRPRRRFLVADRKSTRLNSSHPV